MTSIHYTPLLIPFFAWLFSLMGTAIVLSLLRDLGIIDKPKERSNHTTPVPRGGGIAMVISMLLFLMAAGTPQEILIAAVVLACVSFADDVKGLSVSIRLGAQCAAIAVALMALPAPLHMPAAFSLEWVLLFGAWAWFVNLTNFMDGIDGITSLQMIVMGIGICIMASIDPSLPSQLPLEASVVASATLGFYAFNRMPAKLFMGDVGSITLGFVMGYILICLAFEGQWQAALILPAYYISDATLTLLKRCRRRAKIWQAHSEHAYQQAVRGGLSHLTVVYWITLLNLLLVVLAALSTYHGKTGMASVLIAYALSGYMVRKFVAYGKSRAS